jgi:hypothetical protein
MVVFSMLESLLGTNDWTWPYYPFLVSDYLRFDGAVHKVYVLETGSFRPGKKEDHG